MGVAVAVRREAVPRDSVAYEAAALSLTVDALLAMATFSPMPDASFLPALADVRGCIAEMDISQISDENRDRILTAVELMDLTLAAMREESGGLH